MKLFSRLFGGQKPRPPQANVWPNVPSWSALKDGVTVQTERGPWYLWGVLCGNLTVPSGRLVACDPFAMLRPADNPFVEVPRGVFPVVVTLADVSEQQDRSHIREAYASIVFSEDPEAYRKAIPLAREGEKRPEPKGDEFIGFGVDAGTACFVDDTVIARCMPDPVTWHESLFENDEPECWFNRMDDPKHIRAGIANITLPLAKDGENLVLFHSGWGDGYFPVVGSFDAQGALVAAHIDFLVIP